MLVETFAYRRLSGNAYWWLNKPDETSEPTEIWGISPGKILPVPDGNMGIQHYAYNPGFGMTELIIPPDEIVHFKAFHPTNRYIGLSPIEALAGQVVGDLKAVEWNANVFAKDNAKIPGALVWADMVQDPEWERIKRELIDEHGGVRRSLMLLRGAGAKGVSWLQMGVSQKDLEFLEGRQFTKEEIFAVFAPGLASLLAINATEANAVAGRATFLDMCIWPMHQQIAEKITNDLLPLYGDNLMCEFDDVRKTDRVLELQEQDAYERTHTLDEVRARWYGDESIGDERGALLMAEITKPAPFAPSPPAMTDTAPDDQAITQAVNRLAQEAEVSMKSQALSAMEDEMRRWRKMAKHRLVGKNFHAALDFESDIIPAPLMSWIKGGLERVETGAELMRVFDEVDLRAWGKYYNGEFS